MKKVFLIALTIFISLSPLFAAGSQEQAGGKVVVEVFQAKVEIKDQLEAVAQQYMASHPDVQLNVTTIGGGEDWKASLQSKFLSGNAPDIFVVNGPEELNDWISMLADLSDTACALGAYDTAIEDVTVDGKVYGLPVNLEGFGLVYNKSIFEKAGIDADEIDTWNELVDAVKLLDSKKEELGLTAVFAQNCSQYQALSNMAATIYLSPELENGRKTLETAELEFTYSDEFKEYIDLLQQYGIQPSLSVTYADQVNRYFCLGEVAIIPQGNWIFNTIKQMDAQLAENVGIMGIPIDSIGTDYVYVNVPYYWVVNKDNSDEVIEASKDFLDWLYTSEEGKDLVVELLSFLPAYTGYEDMSINDPLSQDIYDCYTSGNSIPFIYNAYPAGFANEFADYLQSYIAGRMEWSEVIENTKASWRNLK